MASSTRSRRERDRDRRVFTPRRVRRIEGGILLVLASVALIMVTLRPRLADGEQLCIACGPHPAVDALVHVLLFIPIGAGLALLGVRVVTALAVGTAVAILIETLQLALPLGRVAAIVDLATSVLGTAIGFHVALRRRALVYPRSAAALRYASRLAAAWLLVLMVSAFALLPTVPEGELIAQWRPHIEPFERYTGTLLGAHVSGIPVPDGPVAQDERLAATIRQGLRVEASIEPGAVPLRMSPILRVINADSAEVFLLGQRGDAMLFRSRVRGTAVGLVTPTAVMPEAMASLYVGDRRSIVANGRRERGELRVGARGSDAMLSLHSAAGWLLLVPAASALQESSDIVSAIWIGLPLFVAAYWAGRRARRQARRAGDVMRMRGAGGRVLATLPPLFGVTAVGLAGLSALFGLSQPPWAVWVGAATAIGSGLVVGAMLAMSHDDRTHGSTRPDSTSTESLRFPPGAQGAAVGS